MPDWAAASTEQLTDREYQDYILQGVSRTFALTIPQLPDSLGTAVSNAYLLCRITDTIEDEPALSPAQKRYFSDQFVKVVNGEFAAEQFARELHPLLSDSTLEAERDLVEHTARVIRLTHGFNVRQRAAMARCVDIMANGMARFQAQIDPAGLANIEELNQYCYYVAGVVGEMLTDLFCEYSDEIAQHRDTLQELAVSFGQGLQMTNILKDVWEDRKRGACWLPKDIFRQYGFDLGMLSESNHDEAFAIALEKLIAIAHAHLQNALCYTLLIPSEEKGIRRFCFWALGMALLTLRKINKHRDYTSGNSVKISRKSVKATIFATDLVVGGDLRPRLLFRLTAAGLPHLSGTAGGLPSYIPPREITYETGTDARRAA
ncbi:MAG: squalene/phytoene synthase family protein [Pseudomonadota bacterium]|nr:MAG: squalene/phytoene synthase family protein [Pseudomonadota bacterium]